MTNDEHYKKKQDEKAVESVVQPNDNDNNATTTTTHTSHHKHARTSRPPVNAPFPRAFSLKTVCRTNPAQPHRKHLVVDCSVILVSMKPFVLPRST